MDNFLGHLRVEFSRWVPYSPHLIFPPPAAVDSYRDKPHAGDTGGGTQAWLDDFPWGFGSDLALQPWAHIITHGVSISTSLQWGSSSLLSLPLKSCREGQIWYVCKHEKNIELKSIILNPHSVIQLWRQETELEDFREMVYNKLEIQDVLSQPNDPLYQTLLFPNFLFNGGFTRMKKIRNQNSLLGIRIRSSSNPTAKI